MKEKAESVRHLGGSRAGEFADSRLVELEELGIGILPDLLGELAQTLDGRIADSRGGIRCARTRSPWNTGIVRLAAATNVPWDWPGARPIAP